MYLYLYLLIMISLLVNFPSELCRRRSGTSAKVARLVPPGTPSPPTKSSGFRGFDSSKLLILRGGNSHVRRIL